MARRKALVIYGSNSGNTKMVAEWIGESLKKRYETTVTDVTHLDPHAVDAPDILVFGSNTWLTDIGVGLTEGQLPSQWFRFAELLRAGADLQGKPVAVFSLGRHEYSNFCASADHLIALLRDINGTLLGEPLRVDGFPEHQQRLVTDWVVGTFSEKHALSVRK